MILNIPAPVWCVLLFFYGYGAVALITGKAWNRWTGQIVSGPASRIGGATLIAMGVTLTLGVYYPGKTTEISATMFLLVINSAVLQWLVTRRNRFPRLEVDEDYLPKRKRKRMGS